MSCSNTTIPAADHGGATAITAVHPEIIQTHILKRLDGATLASAGSAFSQLRALCSEENLWRDICNSTWPSTTDPILRHVISAFPSGHRSFFSDAFPTIHHHRPRQGPQEEHHHHHRRRPSPSPELISAVDILYGEKLIYSKVIVSETASGWFLSSPFRIDLLSMKETVPTPVKFDGDEATTVAHLEEHLRLSWILIDPSAKRAVNISSLKPVNIRRHWLTGDIKIRFGTVVDGGGISDEEVVQCSVVAMCEGKEGGELHVREVSMQVEDVDGKTMNGKDSMVILQDAMERKRKKREEGEAKEGYKKFVEYKKQWREIKQRRENRLDMACIAGGITILMAFFTLVLLGSERGRIYFSHLF
ncbi:PREDICTED: F-box protein At2g27310 [Ipomoea nil]|uniref:F-box protein At2g27310 n=1 Tax=Ipomoea nil TaxID=35883 RepID=UPI0009016482|nr:PREDICTED: F-box protein At2g27310 [Ipomoea nil]